MSIDFSAIKAQLGTALSGTLSDLLSGAAQDIAIYANTIASDLILVAQLSDPADREARRNELLAQLRALGELNRLRANNAQWDTIERIVDIASTILTSTLMSITPAPPTP